MLSANPDLIPLMVQEVFRCAMEQDLPAAKTLLPEIEEPPLLTGREIRMVTLTFPDFGAEADTAITVGEEGLVTLVTKWIAFAGETGNETATKLVRIKINNLRTVTPNSLIKLYTSDLLKALNVFWQLLEQFVVNISC